MFSQPTLVTVLFRSVPIAELHALLRTSNVWVRTSGPAHDELGACPSLPVGDEYVGELSFVDQRPGQSDSEWLDSVLELVDSHHDGILWTAWRTIDVVGLDLTHEVEAVARDYGDLKPVAIARSFRILQRKT